MNEQKHLKRLLVYLTMVSLLVGATLSIAYMFKKAEGQIDLQKAIVSCTINNSGETTLSTTNASKSTIVVNNTGNVATYVRVRVQYYWANAQSQRLALNDVQPSLQIDSSKWLRVGDTYYYRQPLQPGKSTSNLLSAPVALVQSTTAPESNNAIPHIECFAEAIQALPDKAVLEAWGASVDQNGTITGVAS